MKKSSFLILLCFVFFQTLKAQTIQIPNFTTAANSTTTITLSTLNFGAIVGIEGGIIAGNGIEFLSIGSAILTDWGFGNYNIINPNQIAIAWIEPSLTPINLPDGTAIFQVQIKTTTNGNGTITFGNNPVNNSPPSVIDQNLNTNPISNNSNGTYTITPNDPIPPTLQPQNNATAQAPIDGGVLGLLAAGLTFGFYKFRKKDSHS